MKQELNRKQYMAIRKMDHGQMQTYFNGVYERGYQDGEKQTLQNLPEPKPETPDLGGLAEFLQNIKGVGGAKARVVAEAVVVFLERKAANANETGS